jgi:hypothetical protein
MIEQDCVNAGKITDLYILKGKFYFCANYI